jgi:hypothetical protein
VRPERIKFHCKERKEKEMILNVSSTLSARNWRLELSLAFQFHLLCDRIFFVAWSLRQTQCRRNCFQFTDSAVCLVVLRCQEWLIFNVRVRRFSQSTSAVFGGQVARAEFTG